MVKEAKLQKFGLIGLFRKYYYRRLSLGVKIITVAYSQEIEFKMQLLKQIVE